MTCCHVANPPVDASGRRLSLLDICLLLHVDNTGAVDDIDRHRIAELRAYLVARLERWEPQSPSYALFDGLVRLLCIAVLSEPTIYHDDNRHPRRM